VSDELKDEIDAVEADADTETPAEQQYEGDDDSAMETARRRMAERDSEYSAKFAELTEDKPAAKKSAASKSAPKPPQAKRSKFSDAAFAEDAPLQSAAATGEEAKAERRPDMTAPIVKTIADKVRSIAGKSGMSMDDVNADIRSAQGNKSPAKKDSEEYAAAWRKLK
jgi:hypothetical protein